MKYRISMTVHGALEGELQGTVEADNMEEAREKAYRKPIGRASRPCVH